MTELPRLRIQLRILGQWIALGVGVGVLSGLAAALFLVLLESATRFREGHLPIVFLLPVAGLVVGFVYQHFGQAITSGNNLVVDTIVDGGAQIPLRMAPMVLFGTVVTHLFGGSAGREGTAVQVGASLADWVAHRASLGAVGRRQLVAAGAAGGVAAVFGTPIAGTLFGAEFAVLGTLEYATLIPALVASITGDMVTRAIGIVHTPFPQLEPLPLTWSVLLRWLAFAVAIALTSVTFVELIQLTKKRTTRWLPALPLRLFASGLVLIGLWQGIGSSEYLGLGVPTILRAFHDPSVPEYAFLLKLVFTVVTVGCGFLGGEVTPLFFIGATLGNTLGQILGLPLPMSAAVGLIALFAAASNTPLALSIMAVELFGGHVFPHVVIVCLLAYVLTGHRSIYPSQRVLVAKSGTRLTKLALLVHKGPPEGAPAAPPPVDGN